MATQSFMKTFTVRKRDAEKLANVISSKKKNVFEKEFTNEDLDNKDIKDFLGIKSHGAL